MPKGQIPGTHMKIETGRGSISLITLIAIWSVSAVVSLPGLAVSPIMGDLSKIFPKVSDLEIQMLTSLPSLLVIPFVLLSGKLSVGKNKLTLLVVGLWIFFICGILCLFAHSMTELIVYGSILGIGAGMIVPLSTGLIADYFTGEYRTRQLGLSSAINNMTLVLATLLTGYLAGVEWRLPFVVYLLPGVSIALSFFLRREQPVNDVEKTRTTLPANINRVRLAGLTTLYFVITFLVLAIVYYLSFTVENYREGTSLSGRLIALFFLSIMLPGFFINRIIKWMREFVNIWSLGMIACGLGLIALSQHPLILTLGCMMTGLGYGIMQPLIYEKTVDTAPPRQATFALSFVMAANYLAVMICPFLIDGVRHLFHTTSNEFPFLLNSILALCVTIAAISYRKRSFTFGLENKYFV